MIINRDMDKHTGTKKDSDKDRDNRQGQGQGHRHINKVNGVMTILTMSQKNM